MRSLLSTMRFCLFLSNFDITLVEIAVIMTTVVNVSYFVYFVFLFSFACLMSPWQACTSTYGQACTDSLPCSSSNAGSSICSRCSSRSTQTAGYVCPDGNHCRWSGSGFCCRAYPWSCHDRSFQWWKLWACQAWRHLPGKKQNVFQPVMWLEQLWGRLVWLVHGQSEV